MSTQATQGAYGQREESGLEDYRGYGWVMFAATMLGLLGTLNFIEGIAAISNAKFFASHAHYMIGSLHTWGWVVLIIGVAQWLVAIGIFMKNQFARWAGVAVAMLNAIAQLLFIPAYPFWSLTMFTLDILVIYGLVAYGARTGEM
jgi:hypothetical protein